jgi:hypothetical protein
MVSDPLENEFRHMTIVPCSTRKFSARRLNLRVLSSTVLTVFVLFVWVHRSGEACLTALAISCVKVKHPAVST